ncbi:hypothetical protein GCM10022393_24210 [Aquimarina addita]|uniref:histidine kinase n=1 Tax=Aquimarina addita TaxID=870485 RepID=A0ABP6UK85_9FLAO
MVCTGVFINSRNTNSTNNPIPSELQKNVDSLNDDYTIASNNSYSEEKRLNALNRFLEGSKRLEIDSLFYKGLYLKAKLFNKYKGPEKAIDQSYLLLQFAKKNKDSFYMGKALYRLGYYNKKLDNYLEAFQYYNESFKIKRNLKDSVSAGKCLMAMSNIQRALGDYNAGKTSATDGLNYVENSNQFKTISGLYHGISLSFFELGNYKKALFWNTKILNLFNDSIAKNKIGIHNLPIFKNTKANILARRKKYQESIDIFQSLLIEEVVIEKRTQYAQILSNLGYVKFLQNPENSESETMLLNALAIRQQENDLFGLFSSNLHLTKYYKNKDILKAKYYGYATYEVLKDFGDYEALLEILTLITELNPDSLADHQRFKDVSLKLMQLRKQTREIYAPTRFENENLLKQNEEKNTKIRSARNQNTMYLLGILLLLTGIGFVVYFFRQRTLHLSQQNKIIQFEASYETETRISKRLHDELGNDIFQAMMQYQNNPHDPQIKNKLNKAYIRARDISRENNEFETGDTYAEELKNMLQNYAQQTIQLILVRFDTVNWNLMQTNIKITVYRVLQELMTNMQKHSSASRVTLKFSNTDHTLIIKYVDNGVGMTIAHLKSANGLRNTEKRIHAIGGTLIFDSEKEDSTSSVSKSGEELRQNRGFKAEMRIPN